MVQKYTFAQRVDYVYKNPSKEQKKVLEDIKLDRFVRFFPQIFVPEGKNIAEFEANWRKNGWKATLSKKENTVKTLYFFFKVNETSKRE